MGRPAVQRSDGPSAGRCSPPAARPRFGDRLGPRPMLNRRAAGLPVAIFSVAVAGCDAALPEVDPTRFACVDDREIGDGKLPCPEAQFCFEQQCTDRWSCDDRTDGNPGCRPDTTRCEPIFNARTSAARCLSGVHTSTTVIPDPVESCDCPDGLHCVAFAAGYDDGAYPLFMLPEGGPLPAAELGLAGERVERRRCVRACSSEINCPADHTCRPAVVVSEAVRLGVEPLRNTIGACYPNTLVDTSTTTPPEQPDPDACRQTADCEEPNRGCRARLSAVRDHPDPRFPAGAALGGNDALLTRCETAVSGQSACAVGEEVNCASGVCFDGRCSVLCDPQDPITACQNNTCRPTRVTRTRPDGTVATDDVFICR